MSNGLGPMEPDRESKSTSQSEAKKEDSEDSPPKQSLECLHYLKEVQHSQVKMIAIRVSQVKMIAIRVSQVKMIAIRVSQVKMIVVRVSQVKRIASQNGRH